MDYPIHKATASKPRLVASVKRQDQQTPPCLQAVVDVIHVNIRIDMRSALNKIMPGNGKHNSECPRRLRKLQLAVRESFHPPSRAPGRGGCYYWVDSGRGGTID
jgi:hypothetical protein